MESPILYINEHLFRGRGETGASIGFNYKRRRERIKGRMGRGERERERDVRKKGIKKGEKEGGRGTKWATNMGLWRSLGGVLGLLAPRIWA